MCQGHDDREDHGGGTNDRSTNQDRFGSGFEGIAGPVVFLKEMLGFFEVCINLEL